MTEKEADISPVRDVSIDEGELAAQKKMRDVGAELYLGVQQYSNKELEAERKIVLRKIDGVIMPKICVTYTIQSLDKLSLNYTSAYTLTPDLGLQGQRYSWVSAISTSDISLGPYLPIIYFSVSWYRNTRGR